MGMSPEELEGIPELVVASRYLRVYSFPSPAAGADFSVAVPGGVRWKLESMVATLTTSAVVANRLPAFTLSDGSTVFYRTGSTFSLVAAGSYPHTFMPRTIRSGQSPSGQVYIHPLPDIWLGAGYVFKSLTALIDVGDQWSGLAAAVIEERTGPPGPETVVRGVSRY